MLRNKALALVEIEAGLGDGTLAVLAQRLLGGWVRGARAVPGRGGGAGLLILQCALALVLTDYTGS